MTWDGWLANAVAFASLAVALAVEAAEAAVE